jgi:hypothetical protein
LDPERIACTIIQHQPFEAEEIILDFLDEATHNNDSDQTAFWILVHTMIGQMQSELLKEPDYVPKLRFAALM